MATAAVLQQPIQIAHFPSSKSSPSTSLPKTIRFFEYASLIPDLDTEELQAHVQQQHNAHTGRPRFCARTYSVPLPSLFSSPPSQGFANDPSFFPNGPPKLNVRLPSITRRRRNTVSNSQGQDHLKSCLKRRRYKLGLNVIPSSIEETTQDDGRENIKHNNSTMSSSLASVSSLYCPALAKVIHEEGHEGGSLFSSFGEGTASTLSSSPPVAVGHLSYSPDALQLLPIRDCCRACRRAASYGERCSDTEYYEKWTKAALEKRRRDEEAKFERGEYTIRKPLDVREQAALARKTTSSTFLSACSGAKANPVTADSAGQGHGVGVGEARLQGQRCSLVEQAEAIKTHCKGEADKANVSKECKEQLDGANRRLAALDLGKPHQRNSDDDDYDDQSPSQERQEGDGLDLEGVDELTRNTAASQRSQLHKDEEKVEKNPICTLVGSTLRPCSSKSLYTCAPEVGDRSVGTDHPQHHRDRQHSEVGEVDNDSNASSSDLSEDLVSNLSLAFSPASATTLASSWFGQDVTPYSPPLETPKLEMEDGGNGKDMFDASFAQLALHEGIFRPEDELTASPTIGISARRGTSPEARGRGCSPLVRSKCIRPNNLYTSVPEESVSDATFASGGISTHVAGAHLLATPLEVDTEADFRAALKEADKQVVTSPVTSRSPVLGTESSGLSEDLARQHRDKRNRAGSWTSRLLHPGRSLSSLGVTHGIVH